MLGCVMNLQTFQQSAGLGGWECLIQGRWLVGVQVVHDQHDLLGLRVLLIDHLAEQMGEVHRRAPLRHLHPPLPRQRLEDHEQIGRALALVLVIDALRLPRRHRDGQAGFCHQLFAGLIHAHLRAPGIVGTHVDLQHIFHSTDKLGIGLRRNHPLFVLPRFEVVFLSVVRTHSALIVSTTSSATNWSANNLSVHCARPAGGALQAKAISRASWAPSSLRYCRPVGRWRDNAASQPCSTKAWRTRCTVDSLVSKAAAISASVQQRLPSRTSALRRIRAWSSLAAAARPVVMRVDNCWRSSLLSSTMYLAILVLLYGCLTIRTTDSRELVK